MIEYEACYMSDRFGANRRFATAWRAWTNNNQVGIPFSRAIDNFSLRASLSGQLLRTGKIAETFF
jgi:hypothetical protein